MVEEIRVVLAGTYKIRTFEMVHAHPGHSVPSSSFHIGSEWVLLWYFS